MTPATRRLLLAAVWLAAMFAAGRTAADVSTLRWVTTAVAVFVVGALMLRDPVRGALALTVWLVVVGTLRRMLTGLDGFTDTADPLLAVTPVLLVLLGAVGLAAGAMRDRTRFTLAFVAFLGLLVVTAFNPGQGGPVIAITGIAVSVSPMFAFFAGRSLMDRGELTRVVGVAGLLAVPVAVYGIVQARVGFPSWDSRWITEQGYVALFVAGTNVARPFSSFPSGQTFATFAALGLVVVVAFWRHLPRVVALSTSLLLLVAMLYSGVRQVTVFTVAALGLMAAARVGWGPVRAVVVGVLALAALPLTVQFVSPDAFGGSSGALIVHQVRGLSDPFSSDSTLTGHIDLVGNGIRVAFQEPIGLGIGSVSASGRIGDTSNVAAAEADLGNAGIAAGIAGLALYVAVATMGLLRAYRLASTRRAPLELAVLGILMVTFQHWLSSGVAAATWLTWLALGWVDRETAPVPVPAAEPADVPAPA